MTNLAQDYGKLLFQLNYPTETVENFYNILNGSDELLTALDNPTVTKAVKHNIIDKIFDKEVSSFVKCLCDNGRITSYAEVYKVYKELIDDKEGILKATLFVTENPDDDELKGMENMLKSKYNKEKVNISVVNDPELIGGFILKVGDIEYNKSFKYTFNKLKQKYDWR